MEGSKKCNQGASTISKDILKNFNVTRVMSNTDAEDSFNKNYTVDIPWYIPFKGVIRGIIEDAYVSGFRHKTFYSTNNGESVAFRRPQDHERDGI